MTDYKTRFPIGSQWKCRDGSRAIVLEIHENVSDVDVYCYNVGTKEIDWIGENHLIEPWKDPRVFEDEVIMGVDEDGNIFGYTKESEMYFNVSGYRIIARKRITITEGEGEGLDDSK